MTDNLWQSFIGYGIIQLKGLRLEQALSALSEQGVVLYDVVRVDRITVTARVPLRQKRKCMKILQAQRCQSEFVRGGGVLYYITRLKKRGALAAGLFVLIVGSAVSVQFVWQVKIIGVTEQRAGEIQAIVR